MSDDAKTITGTISRPDDTPVSGAKVYFTLSNGDTLVSGGAAVVRAPVFVVTDANGQFSIELKRNDAAFADTSYAVVVEYNQSGRAIKEELGKIQLLEDDVDTLGQLLMRDLVVGRGVDTVVLAAALETVVARDEAVAASESVDRDAIAQSARDALQSMLPVTPNLLQDTRDFAHLCGGQTGVEVPFLDGVGGPWVARKSGDVDATLKVVPYSDFAAEGIPTGGELSAMEGSDAEAVLFNALVFDVDLLGPASCIFSQYMRRTFSLYGGEMLACSSVFVCVLEADEGIKFSFGHNHARVDVGPSSLGDGWLHFHSSNRGLSWSEIRSSFDGTGHMRIAIALPYCGFGGHGDTKIWAGSLGSYQTDDVLA